MSLAPNKAFAKASLSFRFLVSGSVILILAAVCLGVWVGRKIEAGVVQNYGAAAALYFESLVPQIPFLQSPFDTLPPDAKSELTRIFVEGILREKIVTYKVWSRDGTILASFDRTLEDQTFPVSDALTRAWDGEVTADYEFVELHAETDGASIALPLLGVYVPIRNLETGEVTSVFEIYQRAEELIDDISKARRQTWLVVFAVFLASGGLLFGIVHAGSRLIETQQLRLRRQLRENTELKDRVIEAARRSTAQTDRVMRRIGLDLHDGVAQHLSLIALRLEGAGHAKSEDAEIVRTAVVNAMSELRAISRGLALPDIDNLTPAEIVARAVEDHTKAFGSNVTFSTGNDPSYDIGLPTKSALYRVTQELLANSFKHAHADTVDVTLRQTPDALRILVSDDGVGFDTDTRTLRPDGGQGLTGITDRLVSLGGAIDIRSAPGKGTTVTVTLPHEGAPL